MQNNNDNKDLPPEVISALESGNKVEAIKLLRGELNLGLKEAKNIVERYIDADPTLKDKLQQSSNSGCLGWFIILIIIGVGVYFLTDNLQ